MTFAHAGVENTLLDYLKAQARSLHKEADAGSETAIKRLKTGSPAVTLGAALQRKHALACIAREAGFDNWKHAKDCFLENRASYGTFLHPARCRVFWNIWFAGYKEAAAVRAEHGGYLIPYKHQYIVVDEDYVKALSGADSFQMWDMIGRNWVQPDDTSVRDALAFKIMQAHFTTQS